MALPTPPSLDEILSKINLTCESGKTIVGVYVNVGGRPIQGVDLKLYVGAALPFQPLIELKGKYTNSAGVAGYCVKNRQYAEAWIRKSGMDFGSGVGVRHKLGAVTGTQRGFFVPKPYIFKYIGELKPPDICTAWKTVSNISVPVLLRPDIPFPIKIFGAKWECPSLGTSDPVSGVEGILRVGGRNYKFNLINGSGSINLEDAIPDIPSFITRTLSSGLTRIDIEVLIPNKDSGYTTFTKSASLPSRYIIPGICTVWDTVAAPNVPARLSAPFPISVSGAKWVCRDTGEPEFIEGIGKIEIGGYTFDLSIRNGYGRVNLEDLVNIPDLITKLRR